MHKAGFINMIGSPNVGKSTLANQLVGDKLSIITSKAQTTRHRILGMVNEENYQMIFSDLPGIVDPAYRLHKSMMNFIYQSLSDADIFLIVVEAGEKEFKDQSIQKKINSLDIPIVVALNKIDTIDQEELDRKIDYWKTQFPKSMIVPTSALHSFNIESLKTLLLDLLPESPPFFPKDQFTDKSERFIVSEKIREQILKVYKKEVPYSTEVVVTDFIRETNIIRIRAEIIVERDSQKGILIGKGGSKLKLIGTDARLELEEFFNSKIFLEVFVKVDKNWRDNAKKLKKYGYEN
ncbi:GTPase Era [bacterium SCSIO 12643]|nr:GTPase Era [bacterium SCSIO 12643]